MPGTALHTWHLHSGKAVPGTFILGICKAAKRCLARLGNAPSHTAAVTVGTSLITNIRQMGQKGDDISSWIGAQPEGDQAILADARPHLLSAARALGSGRWDDAGAALAEVRDSPRILGAEISSLSAMMALPQYQGLSQVYLLHSETKESEGYARMLRTIVAARMKILCELVTIKELHHGNEGRFRIGGLRSLVCELATIYQTCGGAGLVINATGGYKAQIAIAAVFGQAFAVPVVYRFEESRQVIEFPPLPLTLDTTLVPENLDFFRSDVVPASDLEQRFGALIESNPEYARFRVCVEGPTTIDHVPHYGISTMGQVLYEKWLLEGGKAPELRDCEDQKGPSWGNHHKPEGIEGFVTNLLTRHRWISRIEARDAKG